MSIRKRLVALSLIIARLPHLSASAQSVAMGFSSGMGDALRLSLFRTVLRWILSIRNVFFVMTDTILKLMDALMYLRSAIHMTL
jgi:hypothetical protein